MRATVNTLDGGHRLAGDTEHAGMPGGIKEILG
jgi:hypothetical protein